MANLLFPRKNSNDDGFGQLLVFVMLVLVGYMFAAVVTSSLLPLFPHAFNDRNELVDAAFLRLAQIIQVALLMFMPALAYVHFFGTVSDKQAFNPPIKVQMLFYAAVAFIVALPFVDFLANVNRQLILPQWLNGIQNWMAASENEMNGLVKLMLDTDHAPTIVLNFSIMVMLPALCEEFFFRGVIQQKLLQWWKNPIWAILVSAFVFSAVHLQFMTFLPRFIQGIALGYLFYVSGSIWISVAAHFANNLTALILYYSIKFTYPDVDPTLADSSQGGVWLILVSGALATYCIYRVKQLALEAKQETT